MVAKIFDLILLLLILHDMRLLRKRVFGAG